MVLYFDLKRMVMVNMYDNHIKEKCYDNYFKHYGKIVITSHK